MHWYPFDIQECHLNFTSEKVSVKFVELVPEDLTWSAPRELDQYYIKGDPDLLSDKTSGETVIKLKITFGRRLLSIILTVYFTTLLLNFIGHTAVFYKDCYFEAQLTLNVTVMLVQVTMFTSVSFNGDY